MVVIQQICKYKDKKRNPEFQVCYEKLINSLESYNKQFIFSGKFRSMLVNARNAENSVWFWANNAANSIPRIFDCCYTFCVENNDGLLKIVGWQENPADNVWVEVWTTGPQFHKKFMITHGMYDSRIHFRQLENDFYGPLAEWTDFEQYLIPAEWEI